MKEERKITCRQAYRLLHEQLDGALPPDGAARLREHWAVCAHCAERARRTEAAVALLHSTPPPEPSAALAARIRAAAAQSLQPTPLPRSTRRWAPAWAGVGVVAAAVAVLAVLFRTPAPPPVALTPTPPPVADTLSSAPAAPSLPPPAALPVRPAPPIAAAVALVREQPARAVRSVAPAVRPRVVPTSAAAARPSPRLAYVRDRTSMADMTAASVGAPLANTVAAPPRVTPVSMASVPNPAARNSGDFANEVVGGMVAEAVLADYLGGAPEGLKITPALLTTGGGG